MERIGPIWAAARGRGCRLSFSRFVMAAHCIFLILFYIFTSFDSRMILWRLPNMWMFFCFTSLIWIYAVIFDGSEWICSDSKCFPEVLT